MLVSGFAMAVNIYIMCDVETTEYTKDFDPSLCSSVHSVANIEMNPFSILLRPVSYTHLTLPTTPYV